MRTVQNSIRLFFLLAAAWVSPFGAGADSSLLPPSITTAPLSVDPGVNASGSNTTKQACQYRREVDRKARSQSVYRGKVWVAGTDFAVTRIDAEPAQNPSFWTKKNAVHHEYMKVQNFWLPRRNESVSYIRLGGRATLTIEYKNYRVTDSRASGNAPEASSSNIGARYVAFISSRGLENPAMPHLTQPTINPPPNRQH